MPASPSAITFLKKSFVQLRYCSTVSQQQISQDFSILHSDAADRMCLSWLHVFADKILAFAKRDGRQMDVLNLDNMSAG